MARRKISSWLFWSRKDILNVIEYNVWHINGSTSSDLLLRCLIHLSNKSFGCYVLDEIVQDHIIWCIPTSYWKACNNFLINSPFNWSYVNIFRWFMEGGELSQRCGEIHQKQSVVFSGYLKTRRICTPLMDLTAAGSLSFYFIFGEYKQLIGCQFFGSMLWHFSKEKLHELHRPISRFRLFIS